MLVSRRRAGEITHHAFTDLPGLLLPGDLLVVNTSGTLPAAVRCAYGPSGLSVHFSTPLPESVVPAFRRLIAERMPSGRYRAADLMPVTAGAAAEAELS